MFIGSEEAVIHGAWRVLFPRGLILREYYFITLTYYIPASNMFLYFSLSVLIKFFVKYENI